MLHFVHAGNRSEPQYADMLEQSYRIRHDVFVKWRGWKALDRPDGREIDQFDNADAKYLMWTDGGEVVGGARFLPTNKPHLQSEIFPAIATLAAPPRAADVWEGTRLFTSRTGKSKANRRDVSQDVLCAMFEMGLKFKLKAITVICDTFFLPRLLEDGVVANPLGLPTPYDEGICVAIVMPVSVEQLLAVRGAARGTLLYAIDTGHAQHRRPDIGSDSASNHPVRVL
jgi:acyl-homoserine lactone synthase